MKRCPFHSNSEAVMESGDIFAVKCSACGEYRISDTALDQLEAFSAVPAGWSDMVTHRAVISTRDTRDLA